jgi:hypothetical protein
MLLLDLLVRVTPLMEQREWDTKMLMEVDERGDFKWSDS